MLAADTKTAGVSGTVSLATDSLFAWKQIVEPVEGFLQAVATRLAEQVRAFDPEIAGYAEYALNNQGKQLRPVLVGLSGGALGRLTDAHVTVAVIIEMVHLATLVHDDVMDGAQIRRGQPTLAANWGNDVSVLLGDCLFAHALELAASFPTPEVCRTVSAATNTVCAGEILQTRQRRNFNFSQADYFKAVRMKTGELFALSCELGAFLGAAGKSQRKALRQFGMALGTAYQVFDDCIDLFGSEARVGKSLGTDLATGKLTLPVLLLLERSASPEAKRARDLIENWKPSHLRSIQQLLKKNDTLTGAKAVIRDYLDGAREQLDCLPTSKNRAALAALTEFLGQESRNLGGTG